MLRSTTAWLTRTKLGNGMGWNTGRDLLVSAQWPPPVRVPSTLIYYYSSTMATGRKGKGALQNYSLKTPSVLSGVRPLLPQTKGTRPRPCPFLTDPTYSPTPTNLRTKTAPSCARERLPRTDCERARRSTRRSSAFLTSIDRSACLFYSGQMHGWGPRSEGQTRSNGRRWWRCKRRGWRSSFHEISIWTL